MIELKKDGTISMTEGDYGSNLEITIPAQVNFDETVSMVIKDVYNEVKIEKYYNFLKDNVINFSLTQKESQKLTSNKKYVYSIDWYKNGVFLRNIVNGKDFIVERRK